MKCSKVTPKSPALLDTKWSVSKQIENVTREETRLKQSYRKDWLQESRLIYLFYENDYESCDKIWNKLGVGQGVLGDVLAVKAIHIIELVRYLFR